MTPKKCLTSTRVLVPGVAGRVRVLHVTDVHICRVDQKEEHAAIAVSRKKAMDPRAQSERRAEEVLGRLTARDFDAVIVTGDLVDFPSRSAVDWVHRFFKSSRAPLHFVCGNHDSQFPWSENWDARQRAVNLELWAKLGHRRPKLFDRWEVRGLQFLTVDDANYQIDAEQLEFTRKHLATGQPTVLALHIPLTQPRLLSATVRRWRDPILLGEALDDEQRAKWNADPAAAETKAFIRLVRRSRNLRAVLCGHVHFGHEEHLSEHAVQLVGPPGYESAFRVVDFEPAGL